MSASSVQLYAPEYPVKSVTIFKSSKAEVVRTFEVDLKAGQNKIEILGLPNAIDTDSVRVSGKKGSTELRLHDVVCTISDSPPAILSSSLKAADTPAKLLSADSGMPDIPETTDPEEALRILKVYLESLKSQKRVREHEGDVLLSYSKSLTAVHAPPFEKNGEKGFSIGAFLDEFVSRGRQNVDSLTEIGERIVEVERKIKEQLEKAQKRKGKRNARVDIVLGNSTFGKGGEALGKVEVKVTYIVSSALWEPTYELHATTSPTTGQPIPKIALHYRALISQSTGEDWTDASLTLSTVSSSFSFKPLFGAYTYRTEMPTLKGVQIRESSRPTFNNFSNNTGKNMFGRQPPQPSVGGSFGHINQPQPGGIGIFEQLSTGGSTFGSAPPAGGATSQFGTGGLFGSAQQTAPAGGSTFGSSLPAGGATPRPATGGLFGSAQQPAPAGGSMFGSTGFGAFGGSSAQAQNASAFGSSSQAPSTSLFGNVQAQPQAQSQFGTTAPIDGDFEQVDYPNASTDIPLPTGPTSSGQGEEGQEEEASQGPQTLTTVSETPLAITYSVDGKVLIPSDGVKHQVPVAVLVFGGEGDGESQEKKNEVFIKYGVVPRIDTKVYLQCRVKNTSEYRLFPGPVGVILDDGYIAKTSIGDTNINDTFTCTLGTDLTTQVKYTRTSRAKRSQGGPFAEAFNLVTYNTKVVLWNKHSFDLKDLRVYDCVPVYEKHGKDSKVSVILRKPSGLADAEEGQVVKVPKDEDKERQVSVMWEKVSAEGHGGQKAGKLEWKISVPAGKKETLELEWEVKAPLDMPLVESLVQ